MAGAVEGTAAPVSRRGQVWACDAKAAGNVTDRRGARPGFKTKAMPVLEVIARQTEEGAGERNVVD